MMLPSYFVASLVRRTVNLLFLPLVQIREELEFYTIGKSFSSETNSFSWWKINQFCQITLSYIYSPATSTSVHSEHICSIANGTVWQLCAVLESDTVDKLVLLDKRFKYVPVQASVYVKRFSKHSVA